MDTQAQMPLGNENIEVITKETIGKMYQVLQKYKNNKVNLEEKIVANEQWYKMRHWEQMGHSHDDSQVQPTSAWLFNFIANKHASAMDNFPSPNILPREEGDKQEASQLSDIVPVILENNDFEKVYSDEMFYKLISGTGVFGTFWDGSKNNGLGDISVKKIDLLKLFWESGVTDIQDSKNLFYVELVDNDILENKYPQLRGKLGNSTLTLKEYRYDDQVDLTDKSAVIDWYYKRSNGTRTVLHLCKFVNDEILFASENEPMKYPNGWYNHGQYPFVFDPLYTMEGTPTGFGYVDIGKNAQEYIDRGNQAILENMLANARPRYFFRNEGSVNIDEYLDYTKPIVHVDGQLGDDSVRNIETRPLPSIYLQVINNKIDELKEVTGNRDVSNGGTSSGVTAASAIAAMQEAGSKLDRDNSKSSYRAYRQVVLMVIELIRQFYNTPRSFRILGENNQYDFIKYSNDNIRMQPQGDAFGIEMGYRLPLFDVTVTAEKASPYSKMSQNELALQFLNAGFFAPQMSDQALACLEMMDFDNKEFVMEKIQQNGTLFQTVQELQAMVIGMQQRLDGYENTNLTQQMAMGMGAFNNSVIPNGQAQMPNPEGEESSVTKNARQRVADSTTPV